MIRAHFAMALLVNFGLASAALAAPKAGLTVKSCVQAVNEGYTQDGGDITSSFDWDPWEWDKEHGNCYNREFRIRHTDSNGKTRVSCASLDDASTDLACAVVCKTIDFSQPQDKRVRFILKIKPGC